MEREGNPDIASTTVASTVRPRIATGAMLTFAVVGRSDEPLYLAELASTKGDEASYHLHQFVLYAALDAVDEAAWRSGTCYLKAVDRFEDMTVSAYVTAGGIRMLLLHQGRGEDGIKSFFQDVHEAYVAIAMNPMYTPTEEIRSSEFDRKVKNSARKHL